jgi:hypothetical protein
MLSPLQGQGEVMDTSSFESVISFSQSLSQWSVLIIGGLTALLLGDSHLSSSRKIVRGIYLLFLPSWIFLFSSIFMGVKAQRNFLALKVLANANVAATRMEMNDHISCQLTFMQIGLGFIGCWLVCYLLWWVFSKEAAASRKAKNEKAA